MNPSRSGEERNGPAPTADGEEPPAASLASPVLAERDIHRIGGASVENLHLKPREVVLDVPGISVLKAASPQEAAQQMCVEFPKAKGLHDAAKTVGSTTAGLIRSVGFDIIHVPSKTLPNHYRITHPQGVAGFRDENLIRLAQVFVNTTGH